MSAPMVPSCPVNRDVEPGTVPPDAGEAAFVALALCAWPALLLAGLGRFHWSIPILTAAAGSTVYTWLTLRNRRRRTDRWTFAALGISILSLALSLPPSEMLLGGWDPGVYTHIAASMNREGSLLFHGADFQAMDAETLHLFSRDVGNARQPFHGIYLRQDGTLSPQFFHLFPALMAVVYGAGGMETALLLNGFLQAAAVWIFFSLLRRLWEAPWALAGACLLALHPVQIWQAGFPTAELLTQVLLLFGARFLLDSSAAGSPRLPLLAGLAFGLAFMCRYDVILLLVPLTILILLFQLLRPAPRFLLWVLPGPGLSGLHVWLHIRFVAPYYHPLSNLVVPALIAALIFVITLTAFSLLFPRPAAGLGRWLFRASAPVSAGIYLLWLILTLWLRPRLLAEGRLLALATRIWPGDMRLLVNANLWNPERLAAVFGLPAFLLGLTGILLLLWRTRRPEQKAMLYSAAAVMAFLVLDAFHDQFMMWMMRRFLPVVIPLLCLGAVASLRALTQQVQRLSRPRLRPLLTAGLLLLLFLPMLPATRHLQRHRDWPGLKAWLNSVQSALPADAIIYSDQPGFAAPFRFLYGISAYTPVLRSAEERLAFEAHLLRRLDQGDTLRLLSLNPLPESLRPFLSAQQAFPLQTSELTQPRRTIPRERRSRGGAFTLYTLSPSPGQTPPF